MIRSWILILSTIVAGLGPASVVHARERCEQNLTVYPIVERDIVRFADIAQRERLLLAVMPPNRASLPFASKKGFVAKPAELKGCKTADSGRHAGLVLCPPSLFNSEESWNEQRLRLKAKGYSVLSADQEYLVQRDSDGKFFFSDYDLLGVYGPEQQPAYDESLRERMNEALGRRLVRHGPFDDFERVQDLTIKYPLLIFFPNRAILKIKDESELKRVYERLRIPWRRS